MPRSRGRKRSPTKRSSEVHEGTAISADSDDFPGIDTRPGGRHSATQPGGPEDIKDKVEGKTWSPIEPIIVGRPTPVSEPKAIDLVHRPFPYRADTSLDGWSTKAFTIRAASMRGHLHRYNGTPRQDDFAVAIGSRPDQLLIAIADGVSAATQSHVGATAAVRYAVQWLNSAIGVSTADTDWRALVESTAWALIEQSAALLGGDETTAEQAEQLVATTLVCAVLDAEDDGGATVHIVSVGDSGAWILDDTTFTKLEGGKQESASGLSSSAVSGLPRVPHEVVATSKHVNPGEVLLLGTDGVGDPLGSGDGEVGTLLRSVLQHRVPSLIEFAHALDFSRETFDDDRTLVAVWPLRRGTDDDV